MGLFRKVTVWYQFQIHNPDDLSNCQSIIETLRLAALVNSHKTLSDWFRYLKNEGNSTSPSAIDGG
jgi:hypothetical protein